MKEKRLVDANHFMQVLKNIEYALKGELTHGKIKTSVVQMIEGSLNAEPTIAPESLQALYLIYKERPSLNCRPDEAARGLYIGAKLRDILRNQRKTGAFPRRGKGEQRENEGSVLMACRKQDRRERGPVLFLCIVPFSCLWFKIQKIP